MDGILHFPVLTPPALGAAEPVAPGILWLRMRLPFALDHINLWLLADGGGWTIVDTGYALAETKTAWEQIFAAHLEGRPVTRIVVTHFHPDHIGLAGWLGERWQAPLWTTEKEWLHARMLCRDGDEDFTRAARGFAVRAGLDPATSDVFSVRHWSYRRGVPSVPASYHRLGDGMSVTIGGRDWRVVIGEGHAPEHACLYCAETDVLIAGDQVLPKISPNISVTPHEPDGDPLARYLVSLAKLRAAVPASALVLPSHNLPFYGLHERIDALIAHHHARLDDLRVACAAPQSAAEVLPVLFRRRLDAHQTGFALGEALAHLHYLVGQGEIVRMAGADGIDRFVGRRAG